MYSFTLKRYATRIVSPRCEFHPWVEFVHISGQTYLSVYMFNRGEVSTLLLGAKLTPGLIRRDFNV